jgi:hypothetical protein
VTPEFKGVRFTTEEMFKIFDKVCTEYTCGGCNWAVISVGDLGGWEKIMVKFHELLVMGRHAFEGLLMGCPVYISHGFVGPIILGLNVL